MLASTKSPAEILSERLYINYVVPLSKWERRLIKNIADVLNDVNLVPEISVDDAFHEWKWTDRVDSCLKDFFEPQKVRAEFQGDLNKANIGFLQYLEIGFLTDQNVARVKTIVAHNPKFISSLVAQPASTLVVCPSEQDLGLWKTLAAMLSVCKPFQILGTNIVSSWKGFDILELTKKFVLLQESPSNRNLVAQSLLGDTIFRSHWDVRTVQETPLEGEVEGYLDSVISPSSSSSNVEMFSIARFSFHKRLDDQAEKWPENEQNREANGHMTMAYLKYLLRQEGKRVEIEDPKYLCHFIPWNELQPVDEVQLSHAGVNVAVPFMPRNHADRWFLWKSSSIGFPWNHHLYTEDEVFEYNMLNSHWPGQYMSGRTIFRATEIATSEFLSDLQNFWQLWNDCAVTQAPEASTLLLLETVPGLRFRSRCQNQDRMGAMVYFRNLVENNARPQDRDLVRDVLELEATYTPAFEHSLRLIRAEDLSDISWNEPLGRGAHGIVFAAEYTQPSGVLMTSQKARSRTSVVLKEALNQSNKSVRRELVKELDKVFASLGGRASGCIGFLGLAILGRADGDKSNKRMFLVFERASQGPILNFLAGHFQGMDFLHSWETLVDLLGSVGTGICSLHDHGLIHRDLHMNNILVTDSFISHDFQFPHEFKYLISDVGEGKILRDGIEFEDPSENLASYGATEFRAPEVQAGTGWSMKADVFSFGIIAIKAMQMRRICCAGEPPSWVMDSSTCDTSHEHGAEDEDEIVPVAFKKAIELCLQFSIQDRPNMRLIVEILDDLAVEFVVLPDDSLEGGAEDDVGAYSLSEEEGVDTEAILCPSLAESAIPPLKIDWTRWSWKRALRLARKPKTRGNLSSGSKIDLDKPLAMLELV